ncbi:MAG: UDP-N-acetylmuramoyl-L-alanine--D-glutamate ligase [Anaerolineaceae bacterium]|nr:UDP-N-acetylmuramoyl-L-alanine--D-glutamate ligase [Anaerolineaceae bacterium]
MKTDWNEKRVLILGAARQGLALARWLSQHGARVAVSDMRRAEELRPAREALAEYQIDWALGGHPLELLDSTDVLCLSGGVPLTLPIVVEAVKRGIPLSNDSQIFMEIVPCKTVGITGSAGKTTTTTLIGAMAKKTYGENAYVGGNIGDPLLNYVDDMKPEDIAVLELSSFQLEQMTLSPNIAAILNITPNHLDRHGAMDEYTAAKRRILDFQSRENIAVLNYDDVGAWALRDAVKGKLFAFSLHPLEKGLDGAHLDDGWLILRENGASFRLMEREKIHLRGEYNAANALAAFAIGRAAGFPVDAMVAAAEEFRGVPHRLELVRELNGVRWYNNSIASAPERTIAVIHAFEDPIVLLLGGRDKNLPWESLMRLVSERVDHAVIFGEAAEKIERTANSLPVGMKRTPITRAHGLREAVLKAAKIAKPGDIVLFSPGGTSFDEFKDFEERGERFREWVHKLS